MKWKYTTRRIKITFFSDLSMQTNHKRRYFNVRNVFRSYCLDTNNCKMCTLYFRLYFYFYLNLEYFCVSYLWSWKTSSWSSTSFSSTSFLIMKPIAPMTDIKPNSVFASQKSLHGNVFHSERVYLKQFIILMSHDQRKQHHIIWSLVNHCVEILNYQHKWYLGTIIKFIIQTNHSALKNWMRKDIP